MKKFKYVSILGWATVLIPASLLLVMAYFVATSKNRGVNLPKPKTEPIKIEVPKPVPVQPVVKPVKIETPKPEVKKTQDTFEKVKSNQYEAPKNQTIKSGRDTAESERIDTAAN